MAFQPIRTHESGHVIKVYNIDQFCVFCHIFSTRNVCKLDIINIRPTLIEALCRVSTLVSGWVS